MTERLFSAETDRGWKFMFVLFPSWDTVPKKARLFWRPCQHFALIWNKKLNDDSIWRKAAHSSDVFLKSVQARSWQECWSFCAVAWQVSPEPNLSCFNWKWKHFYFFFPVAFGFCCLFLRAASWSHLAELFQERLERVLKYYVKVILSTHWNTDVLGNWCKEK